jgi:Trk K+ transport system NAD-binding subunit
MVGVQFDLMALLNTPEAWMLIVLLLGCAFGVKLAAALVYRWVFSWRETVAAGILLSARLSLIIAVAAIALELGTINAAMHAAIVFLAILTCTLAPVLFNHVIPPQVDARRRGVLLVGLGQLSALLAERLRQTDEAVTLVGLDTSRAGELQQRGFLVIQGDPTEPEILHRAGAETAAALIAVTSQEEQNFKACRLGRDRFGIPNLIALPHDPDLAAQMSEQHIRVVQPQLATVLALEGAWHFPATFDILANPPDGVVVREGKLNNPRLHGRPLRHIRLPGDVLILGLRRSGEALVPRGDTVLQLGDVLMLVGR